MDVQRQRQSERHLTFVEHTRRGPERWFQSQRCFPSSAWRCISVKDVRMYASHGVPLTRPRQMAEVKSLQSQLHNVNGRSASGDRIILPRLSVSEVKGIKTVRLSANYQKYFFPPMWLDQHERGTSNQGHQHICKHRREFRQDQEPSLSLKQGVHQIQPDQ